MRIETCVRTEFIHRQKMMSALVEVLSHTQHEASRIAIGMTCDAHDVFPINNKSVSFHDSKVV